MIVVDPLTSTEPVAPAFNVTVVAPTPVLPIVVLFAPVALMFVVPSNVFVPVALPTFTLPEPVLMFVVVEATLATLTAVKV
ncbi:MAG: hypothetical protein ACK559_15165, partial [bacterium]